MTRDPDDDNQHLPPWLRGLPLPPRPASSSASSAVPTPQPWPEAPAAPVAAEPAGSDEIPDWLRDLTAEAGLEPLPPAPGAPDRLADEAGALPDSSAAGALPSWLDQTAQEQPFSQDSGQGRSAADADLPDWLSGAAGDLPAQEPAPFEPPPGSQSESLPGWLQGAAGDLPAQEPAPFEPPPGSQQPASLPDWLSGAAAELPGQPSASAEPLPSWLSEEAADDAAAPSAGHPAGPGAPSEALPDWLRDQGDLGPPAGAADSQAALWADPQPSPEPPAQPAAPPSDAAGVDDSGIPSWLSDISDDEIRRVMEGDEGAEEGISVEPFSFGEPSSPSQSSSGADVPAWLSDDSEQAADQQPAGPSWLGSLTGEPGQVAEHPEESGPSWLGGLADEPAQTEPASQPDVPLWLQDLEGAQTGDTLAETLEQPAANQPPPTQAKEQMPAWLDETEQAPAAPDAAPAWLQADTGDAAPAANLPAWLNAEAPPSEPEAEIPSWLSADFAAPPASAAAPPPAEDLPPWLSDAITSAPPPAPLQPAEPQPPPAAPVGPPIDSADELPSWLRAETPAPPAEELPDWLQTGPQSAPEPSAAASPPDAGPSSAALADWMQAGPPAAHPPAAPAASPADDLPPWLRDDAGQPLPTAGAPGDANLPEWLRGETPAGPPAQTDSAPPSAPGRPGSQSPSAPPSLDWFGEEQAQAGAGRASAGESEFFGGAELPAWLRKADTEPASEISPADARSLDWLTKLGAHEEESVAVAAAPAVKLPLPPAPMRSNAQISSLALLRRLAAEPYPDVAPAAPEAEASILRRIGLDRVLYVVLLVALLAALAVPSLAAGLQAPPQDPAATALFQQIDKLTDKDVVLIGYEWDARRIGELKPLEQAVIGHLIQKRVKLILISTDPQGTMLLFDLRDDLVRAGYRTDAQDYVLLGYKPGGDLALRSLAQDFRGVLSSDFQGNDATVSALVGGFETGKPINSLNDLALKLVLADDASDVQGWVEQVYRPATQKPIAFLLPAEAAPIVQPYLQPSRNPENAQIGHLAGKQGALAYEQLRGSGQTATVQVAREIGQQRLGILVFVVLLLVGGIAAVASGALRQGAGT